jgi:1-acyl-sn-glycerol-3-phosphate acyltransferase
MPDKLPMSRDQETGYLAATEKTRAIEGYRHEKFILRRKILRFLMRYIGFTMLARVDTVEGLEWVPRSGPMIVMINHIAFIDSLSVMTWYPRLITPMAKKEVFDYPLVGIFPYLWHVIPVERAGVDRQALRKAEQVLQAGETILIAPEGTRSPALQQAREGVAFLAARTGAPIQPVAIDNSQGFPTFPFSRRWWQPGARVRIGQPFRFRINTERPHREQLRQMTEEAMIVLARLLPEHRRGYYAGLIDRPLTLVEFITP